VATVLGEGLAQDSLVIRKRFAVAISQLLEQLRRPLDVSEEEGNRADRQLVDRAHRPSVSPLRAMRHPWTAHGGRLSSSHGAKRKPA
jgi:hypothetical protein